MLQNVKRFLKTAWQTLPDHFVHSAGRPRLQTLFLLRVDAIGDYVLFRNFLEVLRQSEQYRNYKITLCGNCAWRDLAETLDADFVDEFIWVDRNRFLRNPFYRYRKLKEIAAQGYEVAISPAYSREISFTESIMRLVVATEKIGSTGDLSNITAHQLKNSNRVYTRLLPASSSVMFEFYRNREFFANLLKKNMNLQQSVISLRQSPCAFILPSPYAVLFIGASVPDHCWRIEYFAEIARYLQQKRGLNIIVCGSKNETSMLARFAAIAGRNFIDLTGQTTLIRLVEVIAGCQLLVSNETCAPHLAVAANVKYIFVLYNGRHYGRFVPYPREISPGYRLISVKAIAENPELDQATRNTNAPSPLVSLDTIIPEEVEHIIEQTLTSDTPNK